MRFKPLSSEEMTPEQAEVWAGICGDRPSPAGPFNAWLVSPELARRAASLGAQARLHTSLEPRLSELAILVTARHWNSQTEWSLHEPFARRAGLDQEVIDALNHKIVPEFGQEDEAGVYAFCRQALEQGQVEDAVFDRCRDALGQAGVIELTVLLGYYSLVALSLNVFQVPLPEENQATLEGAEVY